MRYVVLFCLATGPMMAAGFPNHWIVAGACFAAGAVAGALKPGRPPERRGGFLHPPSELNDRIGRYTERERG